MKMVYTNIISKKKKKEKKNKGYEEGENIYKHLFI